MNLARNQFGGALCALALSSFACSSGSSGYGSLEVTTTFTAGAGTSAQNSSCPNGGEEIQAGLDNGAHGGVANDGILEPGEVTSTSYICNGAAGPSGPTGSTGSTGATGASGPASLVVTLPFAAGAGTSAQNSACPTGGEEIETGLDNGAGGGVAGDGILQPGEVTSTSYICNGGGLNIGSVAPPAGPAGSSTITALGGASDAGMGGDGGALTIAIPTGSAGGHVKIFSTGAADASFTLPDVAAPDLGTTPAIVSADTTVPSSDQLAADAGPDTLYTDDNGNLFFVGDPNDGGPYQVTGLSVAADATLTWSPTDGANQLTVAGPCTNAGTITISSAELSLNLICSSFYGAAGSQLVNNGAAGDSSTDGGSSAGIAVSANAIVNQGSISANGGAGNPGGNAGNIYLGTGSDGWANQNTAAPMFNTGAIQANGGASATGAGGLGGIVELDGAGDLYNSGDIQVNGGSGATSGGNAISTVKLNAIFLYAGDGDESGEGSIHNSGALSAVGGSVASTCSGDASCAAGSGGNISLTAGTGTLVNSGSLLAGGGASAQGTAGNGGSVTLAINGDNLPNWNGNSTLAPGDLVVSGSIDTSGGAGTYGGNAGSIDIELDLAVADVFSPVSGSGAAGQEIILYGYASADVSGGASSQWGGYAGSIAFANGTQADNIGKPLQINTSQAGSVVNYAALAARGGAGGSQNGGPGGTVLLTTQSTSTFLNDTFEQVINAGSIDASGGAGEFVGGPGIIALDGIVGVVNSGALSVHGGKSFAAVIDPGPGTVVARDATIALEAIAGPVGNSATLDVSGLPGVEFGTPAWSISLSGTTVTDSGDLLAAGGAASAPDDQGGGSDGGAVTLLSTSGTTSITAPAPAGITVAGGAAAGQPSLSGQAGSVTVDGFDQTLLWTH